MSEYKAVGVGMLLGVFLSMSLLGVLARWAQAESQERGTCSVASYYVARAAAAKLAGYSYEGYLQVEAPRYELDPASTTIEEYITLSVEAQMVTAGAAFVWAWRDCLDATGPCEPPPATVDGYSDRYYGICLAQLLAEKS